jgi:hypothetical protein
MDGIKILAEAESLDGLGGVARAAHFGGRHPVRADRRSEPAQGAANTDAKITAHVVTACCQRGDLVAPERWRLGVILDEKGDVMRFGERSERLERAHSPAVSAAGGHDR